MGELPNRLFALMDLLRGHGTLSASALARHLGVSERTIRRDVERLQSLEVGVQTTPGRRGGIALTHGALLPTLRFTENEALALALGLQAVRQEEDSAVAKAAGSAIRRLEQVLGEQMRAQLGALMGTIQTPTRIQTGQLQGDVTLGLARAIQGGKTLEVRYRSRENLTTDRRFDPYGVVHLIDRWYTVGYCHLRQAVRTFRLDRLSILSITAEHFEVPRGFDALRAVSETLAQAPFADSVRCRVRLETDAEKASHLIPPAVAMIESLPNGVLLTALARPDQLEQVALHLLGLPWRMEILEPVALKEAFKQLGKRATSLSRGAVF